MTRDKIMMATGLVFTTATAALISYAGVAVLGAESVILSSAALSSAVTVLSAPVVVLGAPVAVLGVPITVLGAIILGSALLGAIAIVVGMGSYMRHANQSLEEMEKHNKEIEVVNGGFKAVQQQLQQSKEEFSELNNKYQENQQATIDAQNKTIKAQEKTIEAQDEAKKKDELLPALLEKIKTIQDLLIEKQLISGNSLVAQAGKMQVQQPFPSFDSRV